MPRTAKPLLERIEKLTAYEPNTGCWLWMGSTTRYGYGEIRMRDYPRVVHRLRYESKFGSIPKGLCVLHRCDNALCSNPDHMFLGTKTDNNNDRHNKGRTFVGKRGPRFDATQIKTIRSIPMGIISYWDIAHYFRVNFETISSIIRKKTYKNIQG